MMMFRKGVVKAFTKQRSRAFFVTHVFLSATIVVSIVAIILDSVASLSRYDRLFFALELIASSIFAVEYLLRIYVAKHRIKYICSFWGIIDLLSVLPTFLHLTQLMPLESARAVRILRALRAIRLAKLARRYTSVQKKNFEVGRITFMTYVTSLFSSIILLGSLFYLFEAEVNNSYKDMPSAMFEASKLLLGIDFVPPATFAGNITMLIGGFVGLALLGLLIGIIGPYISRILLGTIEQSDSK